MILIIGAGISGLCAAERLRRDFLVLERSDRIGGLSGEYVSAGHRFGYSGHFFHFQGRPDVQAALARFSRFRAYRRDSRVWLFGRLIPFPLQYHIAGLPAGMRREVLAQMEARGGPPPDDLEGFLRASFGERLFEVFFRPFQAKYQCRPLAGLLARMDRGSIPVPDLASVRAGASGRRFRDSGYNPVFYAPRPSADALLARLAAAAAGRIRFGEEVTAIDGERRVAFTARGAYRYDALVSTMPLPRLLAVLRPAGVAGDGTDLNWVGTLVVNAALRRRRRRFHWVYLPDPATPFYRAGYYPHPEETACYLERSLLPGEKVDPALARAQALAVLAETGMIAGRRDVLHLDVQTIPIAYVQFDRRWPETAPAALRRLRRLGIHSTGRYGSWNYSSMADDAGAARDLAETLNGTA